MEALTKPIKFVAWQITKIKDMFGKTKVNIRLYSTVKGGGLNYAKSQNIYCKPAEWEIFKKFIRGSRKRKE